MKTLLYVLAIVVTGAAGYFSYSNVAIHQDQLTKTQEQHRINVNLKSNIDKVVKTIGSEEEGDEDSEMGQRKIARVKLADTTAEAELKVSKRRTLNNSLSQLNNQLATQEEQIAKIDEVIAKIEKAFAGQNVNINNVASFVEQLNEERKDLSKLHEEVLLAVETKQEEVDKTNNEISELNDREDKRIASLRGNSVSSLITAVNSDWGFVVIKPHPDAQITVDSQLIVVRGSRHLARLNINAVEANRVIADIDYDSIVSGARIHAGDRVILSKARTR